ncbi:thymidylate synthase [Pedobacter sp. V48]|uniref:thymidylate synthase n=1 Tax=Pedobacter sp. V48 TaxID=509635 RepID=UPI0003E5B3FF|nr:thymidylate synthase [Pedobacter sp. V48]ETZ22820.1 hypothetical protein N824_21255 [Pedobacter sp. V48]
MQENGNAVGSRIGDTREVLNFKTVIRDPKRRCTVAQGRNCNIFFHLAESFWVLAGRDDLAFITMFNSIFPQFSDDGVTLHGAYGRRLRHNGGAGLEKTGDQFFTLCKRLNKDPDLRRSVIALWDSRIDLGQPFKDIPCNTQLMFRISRGMLHTTVINRSNDLHWGVIANIFQFSMLSEFMSLLIGCKIATQTHVSQSLHFYLDNPINKKLVESDIANIFNDRYPATELVFPFVNGTSEFEKRFDEIDLLIKRLPEELLTFASGNPSLDNAILTGETFHIYGPSIHDIARLMFLYVSYQHERKEAKEVCNIYFQHLLGLEDSFRHKDFWAMAVNYFVARSKNTELLIQSGLFDVNLGNY